MVDPNVPVDFMEAMRDQFSEKDQRRLHAMVLWFEEKPDGSWRWNVNWSNITFPNQIALLHLALECITQMFRNNPPETAGNMTIQ